MGLAGLTGCNWGIAAWRRAAPARAAGGSHFGRALCALAASAALVTLINEPSADETGARAATVTAQPPLEAEPSASTHPAHQSKLQRCNAAARAKNLHGTARDAFLRTCMGVRHAPATARAAAAASAARAARSSSGTSH